jgi:hypothetical protein
MSVLILIGIQILHYFIGGYTIENLSRDATVEELLRLSIHKIDLLYTRFGGGRAVAISIASLIYIVGSIILSIVAAMSVGDGASHRCPSFIVFTACDERHKARELQRFKNRWQRVAFNFFLSVTGGIVSTAITIFLW